MSLEEDDLILIADECNAVYSSSEEINMVYVSIRKIFELSLKVLVRRKHASIDVDRSKVDFLIELAKYIPDFRHRFSSLSVKYKQYGNISAHGKLEFHIKGIEVNVAKDELYIYLEWFFKIYLQKNLPKVLEVWFANKKQFIQGEHTHEDNASASAYKDKIEEMSKVVIAQKLRLEELQKSLDEINKAKIDHISERSSTDKINVNETLDKTNLDKKDETFDTNLFKDIDRDSKRKRFLTYRKINGSLIHDFFMLADFNKWITISENRIIIKSPSEEITFHFGNSSVYQRNHAGAVRIINYSKLIEEIYDRHHSQDRPYVELCAEHKNVVVLDFQLHYLDFDKYELNFQFGDLADNSFAIKIYGDFRRIQIENLRLFFIYLASYICKANVNSLRKRSLPIKSYERRTFFYVSLEDLYPIEDEMVYPDWSRYT